MLIYATRTSTSSMFSFVVPISSLCVSLSLFLFPFFLFARLFRLKNLFGVSLLWLEPAHPAAIFTLVFDYSKNAFANFWCFLYSFKIRVRNLLLLLLLLPLLLPLPRRNIESQDRVKRFCFLDLGAKRLKDVESPKTSHRKSEGCYYTFAFSVIHFVRSHSCSFCFSFSGCINVRLLFCQFPSSSSSQTKGATYLNLINEELRLHLSFCLDNALVVDK